MKKGTTAPAVKDASTSKAPEQSKVVETKKKRKVPEKRKGEPSKRPSKSSKKAPSISAPTDTPS